MYEQSDGVSMGSSLGLVLGKVFAHSLENTHQQTTPN